MFIHTHIHIHTHTHTHLKYASGRSLRDLKFHWSINKADKTSE